MSTKYEYDGADGFDVWPMADEASVRTYIASSPEGAAKQRARDDYAAEEGFARDGDYLVRDRLTDRVYRIAVDYYMRPEFVAGEPREVPMPPAVHVLWGGQAICDDKRVGGLPKDWPDGQRWISLRDVADGAAAPADRCSACWDKAPGLVAGLRRIGADR